MALTAFQKREAERNRRAGGTTVGQAYSSGSRGTSTVGSYTPKKSVVKEANRMVSSSNYIKSGLPKVNIGTAGSPKSSSASMSGTITPDGKITTTAPVYSGGGSYSGKYGGNPTGYSPQTSKASLSGVVQSDGQIYIDLPSWDKPAATKWEQKERNKQTQAAIAENKRRRVQALSKQAGDRFRTPSDWEPAEGTDMDLYNQLTPEQIQQRESRIAGYKDMTPKQRSQTYGQDWIGVDQAAPSGATQEPRMDREEDVRGTAVFQDIRRNPYTGKEEGRGPDNKFSWEEGAIGQDGGDGREGAPGSEGPRSSMFTDRTGIEHIDAGLDMADYAKTQGDYFAAQNYSIEEQARYNQLKRELGMTDARDQIRSNSTLQELEELAATQVTNLSDEERARLSAGGAAQIDMFKLEREQRYAENEFGRRQMERQMDRAIEDREDFNMQQDTKLRRMLGMFGGGTGVETLSGNMEVWHAEERGQRALDDLRSEYADRESLFATKADGIITNYTNNVNYVNAQTANIIEDKYAQVTGKLDDLLDAGMTNKLELEKALYQERKELGEAYVGAKKLEYEFIEKENARILEERRYLDKQLEEYDDDMTAATGYIFENGKAMVDPATGEMIPTIQGQTMEMNWAKYQDARDLKLTQQTGNVYLDGQLMRDANGQPIQSIGGMAEDRLGRKLSLEEQKYYDKTGGGYTGGSTIDPTSISQQWTGDITNSSYQPSVNPDGSIQVPIATGASGDALPSTRFDGGELNQNQYQCGEFVNDFFGKRVMADTYQDKMDTVTTMSPSVGAAFVMNSGENGHTGIVERVNPDNSIDIVDVNSRGSGTVRRITLYIDPNTGKYQDGGRYIQGFTDGMSGRPAEQTMIGPQEMYTDTTFEEPSYTTEPTQPSSNYDPNLSYADQIEF